jgi:PadR family transcriptional regulator, regulatory protein AphA
MIQFVALETYADRSYMSTCTSGQFITSPQDLLDLLALGGEQGTNLFVLAEQNLAVEFYDLKTGFAGEVFQKLSNYGSRLAIVGDSEKVRSPRFRELMAESNKGTHVRFARTREEAVAWLLK